jgi:GR25 family glycosyltransferase involved in LPS biosynthesis
VRCIVINLDSRSDRRSYMASQSALANCSFFSAIVVDNATATKRHPQPRFWAEAANFSLTRKLSLLGLLESHLRVLDHFHAARPTPRALLVLEDDAQVEEGAFAFIRELLDLDWSGTPWDVVRFNFQAFDVFNRNYAKSIRSVFLVRQYRSRVLDREVYCYSAQPTDRSTYNVLYRGSSIGRVAASLRKAALTSLDSMLLQASKSATDGFSSLYCVVRSENYVMAHVPWMLRSSIEKAALPLAT